MTNQNHDNNQEAYKPNNKRIFIWALFDFANTSYSIVVVTFLFAVFFKEVIAEGKPIGDLYWGSGILISMLISAFISPILGAISDHSAGKKRFLLTFTLLCIISTALLFFVGRGDILLALFLFVLANIGFEVGLVFYDSFLPEITEEKNYGRVSGYGYAAGYLGSLATLGLVYPFVKAGMNNITFPISALFFFVFALPIFLFLKEKRKKIEKKDVYIFIGLKRVADTFRNIKQYKNLAVFLLAFFFYIEGVNTVIFFSGIYASSTLNFEMMELLIFFAIVQTTAFVGAVVFGIIADAIGQKKTIVITLLIWIVVITLAYLTSDTENFIMKYLSELFDIKGFELSKTIFMVIGGIAGTVMGATQSTSRS
ncbi:MAG: MFS transporter, partial [Ignavibacteriales bacterium]|nr:MFS transporter [Ignavibacteriales bacterium]